MSLRCSPRQPRHRHLPSSPRPRARSPGPRTGVCRSIPAAGLALYWATAYTSTPCRRLWRNSNATNWPSRRTSTVIVWKRRLSVTTAEGLIAALSTVSSPRPENGSRRGMFSRSATGGCHKSPIWMATAYRKSWHPTIGWRTLADIALRRDTVPAARPLPDGRYDVPQLHRAVSRDTGGRRITVRRTATADSWRGSLSGRDEWEPRSDCWPRGYCPIKKMLAGRKWRHCVLDCASWLQGQRRATS